MQIDRAYIIELLLDRGRNDKATQAHARLPEQVDTERDFWILAKFGIAPKDLPGATPRGVPLVPGPVQHQLISS